MHLNPWRYFVSVCRDPAEVRRRYPIGPEGQDPAPWASNITDRQKAGAKSVAIVALREDDLPPDLCDLYESRKEAVEAHPDMADAIYACADLGGSGIDLPPKEWLDAQQVAAGAKYPAGMYADSVKEVMDGPSNQRIAGLRRIIEAAEDFGTYEAIGLKEEAQDMLDRILVI